MSRQDRWSWFSSQFSSGCYYARRLRMESLEDRRMLAVFSVSNLDDAGAGSLREAIDDANNNINNLGGADQIAFVGAATSGVIALTTGEIEITEALTVTGPGQAGLTIDAQQNSRIFNITASSGDFTIAGLTLTGGKTTGNNASAADTTFRGGAVRSLTMGSLTIDQSTISGNSTTGSGADGGGVFSTGDLTLNGSTVSGNSTASFNADGGGLWSFLDVTLTNSTVSANSTTGAFSDGGGIFAIGVVTLSNSTVTDNHVMQSSAKGGGIWSIFTSINITNSIVAGNTAGGGGPDLEPGTGALDVVFSLIGDNDGTTLAEAQTPDLFGDLIPDADGNLIGSAAGAGVLDPLLGPLVDNGGPTLPSGDVILTHALLFGSPAIDAGDPAAAPGVLGVPLYDQRGSNFGRVQNGRIDMGAFEVRKTFSADFDSDQDVDGADFLAWQRGFGTAAPDATRLDGDADNDRDVDAADLSRWQDQYGQFTGGPLLGVPLGIEFTPQTLVDFVLIDVDSSWIGQGGYFFDIQIYGVGSTFQSHGTQLVALADTTVFDVDGALTSVIVDWTTDTITRQQNEVYTVCIQILRFLGDDGTFELLGEEKCRDFGPSI